MISTEPGATRWAPTDDSHRRSEVTGSVGRGHDDWERAAAGVLRWAVKTRSGFSVDDDSPVVAGRRTLVTARVAGITVVEPVEVVEVVERSDRVGFSYRTLPGHPVSGEEAFIVHRDGDEVLLTIRSLTRPAPQQPWRALHPVLRVAQRVARRRYLRALVSSRR
ncbi:hypothetical protein AS850_03435 [Frondihabitans sp. 762G35]|uniref:DUF1990 family protein n=1 Tax=Frondihabitans sp. 762G35 TaxID=1446794 RepID=UPI000D22151E|nr:DUF1990 family protein [Frondihabitans sp. 762G35]ARC56127.1 hypothetical protein AS850_03435 [Frondihabitans sp. 762G35]